MNGHALMFEALWIGTTSICICELYAGKVEALDYAERPKAVTNSVVDLGRQIFQAARQPERTPVSQPDPGLASSSSPVATEPAEARMTILVHNYVGIDDETLRRAEGVADQVFRHAGVEVGWRRCFPAPNLSATECPEVGPLAPALRLVPRFQFVSGIRPDMMGYSTGNMMTVSLEEAENAARLGVMPVSQILGLIIAHEFGHLLLGRAHSPGGIMRARWGLDDWKLARQGTLFFLPRQAANLRKELRNRSETAVAETNVRQATVGAIATTRPSQRSDHT